MYNNHHNFGDCHFVGACVAGTCPSCERILQHWHRTQEHSSLLPCKMPFLSFEIALVLLKKMKVHVPMCWFGWLVGWLVGCVCLCMCVCLCGIHAIYTNVPHKLVCLLDWIYIYIYVPAVSQIYRRMRTKETDEWPYLLPCVSKLIKNNSGHVPAMWRLSHPTQCL